MIALTAIIAGVVLVVLGLAMAFPDRYQRVLALTVSAHRHKKQIDQGTEPRTGKTPAAGLTISEPMPPVPPPVRRKST